MTLRVATARTRPRGDDPTGQRAAREAEDRQWPDADTWDTGPDALRFPGLYDPAEAHDDEDDDLEPLHIHSPPANRPR
ncbi:hypothetical protein ACIA5D_50660 [Actinoplanes sp. NPDC051513]|uniref:hypothetical protein n=1 Tax=Actinoplanes sp. NPDC051513 TaxID=3363908 RepID=UPI0037B27C23